MSISYTGSCSTMYAMFIGTPCTKKYLHYYVQGLF
nr:MAG TPA: hypothetical protein [Caudoviricetes sp.]